MWKRVYAIIILFSLLVFSGCWDTRGLDKLAFPLAAAYDVHLPNSSDPHDPLTKLGKQPLDVTALVPNLSPDVSDPVNVETLSGTSVADIRQKRGLTDADTYVIGMVKTLIVGEELASKGLNKYMDSLLRGPSISGTIYFAVAAGRGEDILKTPAKEDTNMGTYLISLFDGLNQRTFAPVTTLKDYFDQGKGRNPVAPVLERKEDRVIINGAAIFRKDKLVKKISVEESHDLVMLRGIKSRSYHPFSSQQEGKTFRGAVLVTNTRKVKYHHDQLGHNFLITIKLKGSVEEHSHMAPITEKHLQEMENIIASQLKSQFETFIDKMQNDYKVDCIDILKYALAKNRRALEKEIDHPEFIHNAHIQVEVKVYLDNTAENR